MGKTIITARRHYPNIFTLEGKLDVPEVDNTIRNAWLSIYTLQQDVIDTKLFLEGAIDRGEVSANGSSGATEIVRQTTIQTIIGSPAAGVTMVNAQSNRLPFINTTLDLDGGNNAPEYDPGNKALTIRGTLDITGAVTFLSTLDVTGATTLLSTLDVTGLITSEGGILIDADLIEAFLVRQDGDAGDVFAVNTVTPGVTVTGTLDVSGISTLTGAVNAESTLSVTGAADFQSTVIIDVDSTEALLVRTDGDGADVFTVNTATPGAAVGGTLAVTGVVTFTVPLAVPQGGTGAATFTDHGLMIGSGAGILTVLAEATNGQLPIGSTGADPVLAGLSGTANEITVTDGAGSITLSLPSAVILSGSLEVTTTSLLTGAQTFVAAGEFQTSFELSNTAESNTGSRKWLTAHETHTLSLAATSVTTTLAIPAGARLIGASFNVNTAVTDDGGDDTWSAAFSGGASGTLATAAAAAQDTKVDTLIAAEITTATTEITFTPNGGNFTAGVIEIVVYYETLTSLANV